MEIPASVRTVIYRQKAFYGAISLETKTFAAGSAHGRPPSPSFFFLGVEGLQPPTPTASSKLTNLNCILLYRRVTVLMAVLLACLFLVRRFITAGVSSQ